MNEAVGQVRDQRENKSHAESAVLQDISAYYPGTLNPN